MYVMVVGLMILLAIAMTLIAVMAVTAITRRHATGKHFSVSHKILLQKVVRPFSIISPGIVTPTRFARAPATRDAKVLTRSMITFIIVNIVVSIVLSQFAETM